MFQHLSCRRSASKILSSAPLKTLTRSLALGQFLLALFCVPVATLWAQTPTPVTVPTWQYDNTHSGANTSETALTLANVNVNSFGKLFSLPVDGSLYAQPLYIPGLKMSDGKVHNVVFVASENDSIYAFDADSNTGANSTYIWKVTLLDAAHGAGAGATSVPYTDTGSPDIAPTIGITGTPVIDPATNTMYVVGKTKENGVYFNRLHAIDITTGAERANSPAEITATVAGTGNGSSGGQLTFSPLWENQRPALDFYNGHVYIGFAAHGDYGPWHGWLFAYDGTTMQQSAVVCLSPNDHGSGIWSSGAGMPIDENVPGGRMFVVTGNGPHTSNVQFPFSGSTGYGESVVDFHLANGGLTATDEFTAFNYATLNTQDWDLASGGLLMPPDQQAQYPHILVAGGKEGRTIVLNRDNLGGYAPGGTSNTNALQDIPNQTKGIWGTPAYWNGHVYMWPVPPGKNSDGTKITDVPRMFQLSDGVMGTNPTSQSTITSTYPGASFSISSNDTQDGIAWAVRSDQFNTHGHAVLYAWDATDLTNPIYESDTNSARDAGGPANRFSIPVVTNGKVYVAANGEVDVYGLLNGETVTPPPMPEFSPAAGTYTTAQNVSLSDDDTNANVYYTTDGSTPSSSSAAYSAPIEVSVSETIKAIAIDPTLGSSNIGSAAYVIQPAPATFSLSATQATSIAQGGSGNSTLTITPSGGFTGSVAITCAITSGPSGATNPPTCSASNPAAISGTAAVTSTLTINTQAATTQGDYTATVTGSSGSEVETTTVAFTVSAPAPPPSFVLSADHSTLSINQGGSTSATITITPSGGFTGSLAVTCAVTSSPSGAIDPPTCLASQPSPISDSTSVTSKLTVNTTPASSAALNNQLRQIFGVGGGGALAALLFFCLPFRRRNWQALLSLLLLVAAAAVATGCGTSHGSTASGNSGTTAGSYVVTVTAKSSSSATATTAVTVMVE